MTISCIFCTKNKLLQKCNFLLILQFWLENSLLTIQLFGPNYSNNSNSIQKPENERIWIPNTTIRSELFEYSNNSNNSNNLFQHCLVHSLCISTLRNAHRRKVHPLNGQFDPLSTESHPKSDRPRRLSAALV